MVKPMEILALLAFASIPVVIPASLPAQDWSPAQQEVVQTVEEYTRASIGGNVEEIMSYFHAEFRGWNYGQNRPLDRDQTGSMIEGFYAHNQLVDFEIEPLAVQVRGDVAVVHLRYREDMKVGGGMDVSVAGPWSMTLVRDEGDWLFLSWSWAQDEE